MASIACIPIQVNRREAKMAAKQNEPAVLWLENLGVSDVPIVGGKNASLGELVRQLGLCCITR